MIWIECPLFSRSIILGQKIYRTPNLPADKASSNSQLTVFKLLMLIEFAFRDIKLRQKPSGPGSILQ